MRQPLFGMSAVGFRLEGGFNGPGEPANQWTAWERAGKVPPVALAVAGIWEDPDRVLDAASAAGAETLALSVEWARTEPAPGRIDEAALDRYASILDSASARGIVPIAVLYDVAHPAWLGEELWLTPGSPDRFADHAARVVGRLSSSCCHWVTLRQPNLVARAGWIEGRHPPRRVGALADAWAVVDNFLAGHLLAYTAIHDVQPEADVSLGLRWSPCYDSQQLMVDLLCAPSLGVEREGLDPWIASRRARHDAALMPSDLVELAWRRVAGATAPFGAGRFGRRSPRRAIDLCYRCRSWQPHAGTPSEATGTPDATAPPDATASNGTAPPSDHRYPLDSLLVGWVPPHLGADLGLGLAAPRRVPPWKALPDPGALAGWCRAHALATPGLPLLIEDGFATRRGVPRDDGWDRRSYVRAQLDALQQAGIPAAATIRAYLYYAHAGGGDPTWPDADFGLGRDASGAARRRGLDASADAAQHG